MMAGSMTRGKRGTRSEAPTIFHDRLLQASVVVELAGALWLVPRVQGGWARRTRLMMTPEATASRLTPADIKPAWLGITSGE